jgi:hypothetical protein
MHWPSHAQNCALKPTAHCPSLIMHPLTASFMPHTPCTFSFINDNKSGVLGADTVPPTLVWAFTTKEDGTPDPTTPLPVDQLYDAYEQDAPNDVKLRIKEASWDGTRQQLQVGVMAK